ncbi:MAG TPA: carboxypeptidase-like regulatory domain-containing protein [Bryobacteraceae bacterium]|nr:carboxypeptidase-like regulatory domain-containing protein [Bryobacteraceae bacterium]
MRKGDGVMRIATLLCIPFLAAGLAFGAIDGTVTNGTSNQPQPNVTLTLVKPGQGGMRTLGTTTSDAQGQFHFDKDEPGGGPQLIQVDYQDVTYTTLLTPNIPTSGVDVRIYDATKSPAVTRIAQHMIVVEPSESQTAVNETLIVENSTKQTFANSELGGIRFYLPPSADGQVRVSVQGPAGMPLPRPAIKTNESNVFKVDFPVKPGETQFSLSYVLPVGSPETLRGRIVNIKGQPPGPVRFVVPPGVTLESKDIQSLGREPRTQAIIYNLTGSAYTVDVKGTGSLNQNNNTDESDADVPQVVERNPPVYHHLGWLIGLALGILALGLLILYRSSPVRAAGE